MYTDATGEHRADHVVVEHGTVPADELYHELKAGSRNHGEIDLDALLTGRPQAVLARLGERLRSCSASATPWPAATSTPRSTTRCG